MARVCCRFAPTCSGDLHIGSLYNALLNFLYAKKHSGLFKLRLDRVLLDEQERQYQKNIEEDLTTFGLVPDEVIRSSERLEHYRGIVHELTKHERSYFCDCTVQNLLSRASVDDNKFYHLYRPEKYPPYCKIVQIQVFGMENEDPIRNCGVLASHEATGRPAKCLVEVRPQMNRWWEPWDVGYIHHPSHPYVRIDLPTEQVVRAVKVTWKDRPVLHYQVSINLKIVAEVHKSNQYFVEHRQGQPFMPLQYDMCNFAPQKTRSVVVKILESAHPVDRPYFYDGHCRSVGKVLDLDHPNTVLRLVADERFSKYDTAYWYGRQPNLVLTSVVDDKDLSVTDCIRGVDIEPWVALEGQVAFALNTPARRQHFHGLIVDNTGYKYSKWIESTPIREYGVEPDSLVSYLANKAGVVKKRIKTLREATQEYTGEVPTRHIVIDEQTMLKELRG